jgi:hypothetical protein
VSAVIPADCPFPGVGIEVWHMEVVGTHGAGKETEKKKEREREMPAPSIQYC